MIKTTYTKPEVITLKSSEILGAIGPAQGYGAAGSGGGGTDLSEQMFNPAQND